MITKPFAIIRELYPTPSLPLRRVQYIWSGFGRYTFDKPVRLESIYIENRSDAPCFVRYSIITQPQSTWDKIKAFFSGEKRSCLVNHRMESENCIKYSHDELLMREDSLEITVDWLGGVPGINDSLYLEVKGIMFGEQSK